jgi:hypothetical protein
MAHVIPQINRMATGQTWIAKVTASMSHFSAPKYDFSAHVILVYHRGIRPPVFPLRPDPVK